MSETTQAHYHLYVNQIFGLLFRGLADYFKTDLFPRTNDVIISTYEKAVEHYRNRVDEAGEKHITKFPFITLDPNTDFEPEEHAGRFFYQYPAFEPGFGSKVFGPVIYNDDNITISPVLNRYRGTFDLIVWCGSIYELMDIRFQAFQFFGGYDRYIYPKNIEAFFILPDEFIFYTYNNPYTGESYQLDWEHSDLYRYLIKNINQQKYVFPFVLRPYLKLTAVSDSGEKFGGSSDDISEHRVIISVEWETDIPSHLIFTSKTNPVAWRNVVFSMDMFSGYHKITSGDSDTLISEGELITTIDSETGKSSSVEIERKITYNYILTQADIDKISSNVNVTIDLNENIDNELYIKVYGKYGFLNSGFHWKLVNNSVELIAFNLQLLSKDDVLVISCYEEIPIQ